MTWAFSIEFGGLDGGIGSGRGEDAVQQECEEEQNNTNQSSTEDQVEDLINREGVSYGDDMGGGNLSFVGLINPTVGLGLDVEEFIPNQLCSVGEVESEGLEEASGVCGGEKSALNEY